MKKTSFIFAMLSLVVLALLLSRSSALAQDKKVTVACIAYYNIENLFDTIDSPDTNDTEYTPEGSKQWASERYWDKIAKIAKVIADIGTDLTPDGPAILGLSEVENKRVLNDLVNDPQIMHRAYRIVHYDSPDRRGVDVALIYQPKYFTYLSSMPFPLTLDGEDDFYTRDVLLVSGLFHGEPMHILVNHWPSRRGGERASMHKRNAAAKLNRQIIDSLQQADPKAHILVMGDFNDDPNNDSVKKHLGTAWNKSKLKEGVLYNPFSDFYRRGIGTLAWRDSWNLFDMIIMGQTLLSEDKSTYTYLRAGVFNKRYLLQTEGRFAGYPFRTHAGDTFLGGYSDHFPVYVYIIRKR